MDALTSAADEALDAHRAAGRRFEAGGVGSFVRTEGSGPPVVLLHGLPMSSYLYRRVLPALAGQGLRGIAFDLPGLGLADRPADFDYRVGGLAAFAVDAVDALGLDAFHLVVHDAGGPVGFELALRLRSRVRSLTILNAPLDLGRIPFPGEVLSRLVARIGEPVLTPGAWRRMMLRVGIARTDAVPAAEIEVHRRLALGDNGAATYLAIMRHLREGHDAERWTAAVRQDAVPYPVQLVWGGLDPMLTLRRFGLPLLAATGLPSMTVVPGKHYLQEDHADTVARRIAEHVRRSEGGTDAG